MLLRVMQALDARFTLSLAITGLTNTDMRDNIPWLRVYALPVLRWSPLYTSPALKLDCQW